MSRELANYLECYTKAKDLRKQIESLNIHIKDCENTMEQLAPILEKSVSPICGSACQPPVRAYTNGRYQTLVVFWDGKCGRIVIIEDNKQGLPSEVKS